MSVFKKAVRSQAKLKIGLTGPSGSGKTYSALQIAKGIVSTIPGGTIVLIDTENCSASLYGDRFDFQTCEISPPYTTDKYLEFMKAAEKEKFTVVIIDSISHQWAGEGGLLNRKEQLDARGGNSFANWAKMTPEHERFKSAILQLDAHTICTIRSKQDYVLTENDRGKQAPKKVGMAPVQREGLEYELSVVFDLAMDHSAQASKDRTSLFDGQIFKPGEETGKLLMDWLASGKMIWRFGEKERSDLRALMNSFALGKQVVKDWEIKHGPIATINEENYGALSEELKREAAKVLEDPSAFDNFK